MGEQNGQQPYQFSIKESLCLKKQKRLKHPAVFIITLTKKKLVDTYTYFVGVFAVYLVAAINNVIILINCHTTVARNLDFFNTIVNDN